MSLEEPPYKNELDVSANKVNIPPIKLLMHYAALSWLRFCFALLLVTLCYPANAQTIRTVGPYDIYFYNAGQGDENGASTQNWTAQEIEDVTSSIATGASHITNTPNRQVKLHLLWSNLGGSILGGTTNPATGNGICCST